MRGNWNSPWSSVATISQCSFLCTQQHPNALISIDSFLRCTITALWARGVYSFARTGMQLKKTLRKDCEKIVICSFLLTRTRCYTLRICAVWQVHWSPCEMIYFIANAFHASYTPYIHFIPFAPRDRKEYRWGIPHLWNISWHSVKCLCYSCLHGVKVTFCIGMHKNLTFQLNGRYERCVKR